VFDLDGELADAAQQFAQAAPEAMSINDPDQFDLGDES